MKMKLIAARGGSRAVIMYHFINIRRKVGYGAWGGGVLVIS